MINPFRPASLPRLVNVALSPFLLSTGWQDRGG
jgi:hypothetical protein